MKTLLPISIIALFLFAPAFPHIQKLLPNTNAPEIPFHTPAYTTGKTLPQHITQATTLRPEDGVILLHTIATVHPGAKLTIQPGTTIAVAEYGGILVQGTLEANGTKESPIRFISNELNQTNRTWSGILFQGTGTGTLEHAIFHHASPSISCSLPGSVRTNENTYLFGNLATFGPC